MTNKVVWTCSHCSETYMYGDSIPEKCAIALLECIFGKIDKVPDIAYPEDDDL